MENGKRIGTILAGKDGVTNTVKVIEIFFNSNMPKGESNVE